MYINFYPFFSLFKDIFAGYMILLIFFSSLKIFSHHFQWPQLTNFYLVILIYIPLYIHFSFYLINIFNWSNLHIGKVRVWRARKLGFHLHTAIHHVGVFDVKPGFSDPVCCLCKFTLLKSLQKDCES